MQVPPEKRPFIDSDKLELKAKEIAISFLSDSFAVWTRFTPSQQQEIVACIIQFGWSCAG